MNRIVSFAVVSATLPILCFAMFLSYGNGAYAQQIDKNIPPAEAKLISKVAFFWGMHPAAYYHFRYNYTQNENSPVFAGLNRIGWNREPITADFRAATTPNATTMYGIGNYDLRDDPVVIVVPEIPNRYWSVQATDQYARWFYRMGSQFTGSNAQKMLILGPDWSGDLPSGFVGKDIVRAPSNYLFLAFRLALPNDSKQEVAAVNSIMDSITAVPLRLWLEKGRTTHAAIDQKRVTSNYQTIPGMNTVTNVSKLSAEDFYKWVSLVINDPSMTKQKDSLKEVTALRGFERLGIKEGAMFDMNLFTTAQQEAIREGFEEARDEAVAAFTDLLTPMNGWRLSTSLDYSDKNWVLRAGFGTMAIAGPVPAYSHTAAVGIVGSEGSPLDGRFAYTLTFDMDNLPPVTEFWSIPMYDLEGYFVDNPINRYTVNSFMLENGDFYVTAERQLIFYLQAEEPSDPDKAKNWLPTPTDAGFRLTARYYGPTSSLIDASYKMPLPVKVEN